MAKWNLRWFKGSGSYNLRFDCNCFNLILLEYFAIFCQLNYFHVQFQFSKKKKYLIKVSTKAGPMSNRSVNINKKNFMSRNWKLISQNRTSTVRNRKLISWNRKSMFQNWKSVLPKNYKRLKSNVAKLKANILNSKIESQCRKNWMSIFQLKKKSSAIMHKTT